MSNDNNRENMEMFQLDYADDKSNQPQNNCVVSDGNTNEKNKEKSSGIVVKHLNSEALDRILGYDSSSDDDDDVDDDDDDAEDSSSTSSIESETELSSNLWRSKTISTSSSSSSSTDSDEADDDDDIAIIENTDDNSAVTEPSQSKGAIKKGPTRKKQSDDLDIDDLPPVPDLSTLNINVENEKFILMGHIYGIVDRLVTVAALPNMPAYDLDTLFFLDNKKPLGLVFDVLGQVTSPIYAIRFNSLDDINNLNIKIGLEVFVAPTSQHTQYVFLQQLLKMKGSDASWLDDREVPPEFVDYSDDECEFYQRTKQTRINLHTKRPLDGCRNGGANQDDSSSSGGGGGSSSDAYKRYETTMNKRNLLNTKLNKYIDTYKQKSKRLVHNIKTNNQQQTAIRQIHFDPTVPPPNIQPFLGYSTTTSNSINSNNNNNHHPVNNNNNNNNNGASSVWQQPNYFNFIPNYFAMPPPPPPATTTMTSTTTSTITKSHESPGPSYK